MQAKKRSSTHLCKDQKPIELSDSLQNTVYEEPKKKVKRNNSTSKLIQLNQYQEIPFIPQVKLTKEDMNGDPVQLFLKLQQQFKQYGAVKVSSADQWKSPFCFRYADKAITTRIQKVHKLKKGKAFTENQGAYNVKGFQQYATKFEKDYKFKFPIVGETKQSQLENEYWNLVNGNQKSINNPSKYKVTIQYAADLPVSKHGSGFPLYQNKNSKDQEFNYKENLFNLNNIYKSPTSILRIAEEKKEFISGVTTPWMYMGMQFSTFCWHVEDLWLNSVNYSHKGAIKTWYVVPEKDKQKFDAFVEKKTNRLDLLDRITFMLDPIQLKNAGINVYKTFQRPGDYVCTFFKAYHSGFSQGFNIGEAVNFVSSPSLRMIKQATEHYQKNKQKKAPVLSLEWILHQNARRKLSPQTKKEFDAIVESQLSYLKTVIKKFKIKQIVQLEGSCKYDKNSCTTCRKYLYLSSLKCVCCQKNYCQKHLHDCCGKGFAIIWREAFGKRIKTLDLIQSSI